MFITTMKPQLEVMYYPPLFWPPEFTIKYYIEAYYWLGGKAFKNSLIITTSTTIIATILGCMAGYSFARYKIGGFSKKLILRGLAIYFGKFFSQSKCSLALFKSILSFSWALPCP